MQPPTLGPSVTDPSRFAILDQPKGSPFNENDFASPTDATRAWKLWRQSTRPKAPTPSRPHIPTLAASLKSGVCMQCLQPDAWRKPRRDSHWRPLTKSKFPKLIVVGMNLCGKCHEVHIKSISAGLTPTPEINF